MRRTILLIAVFVYSSMVNIMVSASTDIVDQSLSYFETDDFDSNTIAYYMSHEKGRSPDVLFNDEDAVTLSEKTDQTISFRARFIIKGKVLNLDEKVFDHASTFDQINRKTQFTKVAPGTFKAERPSMLMAVSFDMTVESTNDKNSALSQWMLRHSGLEQNPGLVVAQHMDNYSKILTEGALYFGVFPVKEQEYIVEVLGWAGISGKVPGFIQKIMANEYSDKMVHFRQALGDFLSQKKP